MQGRYEAKKLGSYVYYFIMISQKARYLEPQLPQSDLFSCIAKHFPGEIKSALVVTRPKDAKEMLQLLRELQPATHSRYRSSENPRGEAQSVRKTEGSNVRGDWAPNASTSSPENRNSRNVNKSHNNGNYEAAGGRRPNNKNHNRFNNQGQFDQKHSPGGGSNFQRNRSHNNENRRQIFNRNPRVNNINF